jgi:dUTP pyrophosphatase
MLVSVGENFFIDIKKLNEDAIIPTRGSAYAAGYDLYANNIYGQNSDKDWILQINPGECVKIGTGIAVAIPEGYFGGIYPRSGLATKQGLAPANKVGVIDSDYRGEVIVALYNHSSVPQMINKGDRIAQLIVQPYLNFEWVEVDELDDTDRGDGGFGSSGKN